MTADPEAMLKAAMDEMKRAEFRRGYEAGYRKAFASLIDLISNPDVEFVNGALYGDLTQDDLLTADEIEADRAQTLGRHREWAERDATKLAVAVAAGIAKHDAERPIIAPSPEPEFRPLLIEGPAAVDEPADHVAEAGKLVDAQLSEKSGKLDRPVNVMPPPSKKLPPEVLAARREEIRRLMVTRDDIIRRDWPLGVTETEIVKRIRQAWPKCTVIERDLKALARYLGVNRPQPSPAPATGPAAQKPAKTNGHAVQTEVIADFGQIEHWAAARGMAFNGDNLDEVNTRRSKLGMVPFALKHGPGWRA